MCFMEIMLKWENNEIEEIMLSPVSSKFSSPWTFSEMLPLRGNLVSEYQGTFLIQAPQGWRPLISVQLNILKYHAVLNS